MANVQRRGESMFTAYWLRFRRHLRAHRDTLNDYLEFHRYWAPMRKNTIEKLEVLKRSANATSTSHRTGSVVSKAFSAAGNTAFAVGCFVNPVVAVAGKAVATVASGAGAGISTAAASTMNDIREEAWRLLEDDIVERQALIELGLQYNKIVESVENTIMELKNMSVENFVCGVANAAYTMGGMKSLVDTVSRSNWRNGNLPRDVVVAITDFFQNNRAIEGASEIINMCRKFIRVNPEAVNAAQCTISLAFNVYCLTELMKDHSEILNVFGGGMLANAVNTFLIGKDCYDIAQIWFEGIDKKSVTEKELEGILVYLKKEYDLLERIYNDLRVLTD